jgi:hypothetical protein
MLTVHGPKTCVLDHALMVVVVVVPLTGYLSCSLRMSCAASGWKLEKMMGLLLACSKTT